VRLFGYGSLLDPALPARVVGPASLRGHRRRWGVAMDNRETIPGYKVYLDPVGAQPPVCVSYLDIEAHDGAWVNGALIEIDDALAPALDRRERNYERIDVRAHVELGAEPPGPDADGPVWAFVGRAEGRERCRRARAEGIAVVSRAYLDRVRADFASLGPEMLRDFERTTAPPGMPVLELERVPVPGGAPRTAVEGVV
jgi:cation transport regulator ChaC